jgi:hypothetical protein
MSGRRRAILLDAERRPSAGVRLHDGWWLTDEGSPGGG